MDRLRIRPSRLAKLTSNTYVCPRCQAGLRKSSTTSARRRTSTPSLSRSQSLTTSSRDGRLVSKTNLHSSSKRSDVEQQTVSLKQDPLPTDLTIRRHWGRDTQKTEHHLPGRSFIRDQLRAWSVQNLKQKKENAPVGLVGTGPVRALPNSIFVDKEDEDIPEEDEEFAAFEESLEGGNKVKLVPGDALYLSLRHARTQYAVFLGMADHQYQFLLADGRWAVDNIGIPTTLVLHGYASPEEIAAIREHVPKRAVERLTAAGIAQPVGFHGDVPSDISAPIIQRIRKLTEDAATFHRLHVHDLDHVYDRFADEINFNNMGFVDLVKEMTRKELPETPHGAQVAIFGALKSDEVKIQTVHGLPEELIIIMTPKSLVRQFDQVLDWTRQYQELCALAGVGRKVSVAMKQNPINEFILKCHKLIERSRKIRSPTTIGVLGPTTGSSNHEGPIELQETGEAFTENDKMILEFLWNTYLRLPIPRYKTRHHSIGSLILRGIGAYPKLRLERKIARLLLQEIGCLAPWSENNDESVILPIPGRRGAHLADQLYEESEKLADECGFTQLPETIPMTDTMAHLRKDWGDTEVFCIDKPSAKVLDDGISLERIADMPGAYWLHVHIAHPSAFVDPEHVFARRARHFGASVYTSRTSYQMFPHDFAKTVSLGPRKPVLTVSSLLLPNGDVERVEITAGTINRVTRLHPAAVDRVLGKEVQEAATMTIGLDPFHRDKLSDDDVALARQHLETLQTIEKISVARIKRRLAEVPEYADWPMTMTDMDVTLSFLEPYDTARLTRSYHYLGDPTIGVSSNRFVNTTRVSQRQLDNPLTAQVMMLTSESAGRWLREHDIPAVYNGALTHEEYPLSRLNNTKKNEAVLFPIVRISSTPIPHVILTVAQYCRVTSPLRRFSDLLGQWQIDAFLKAQAADPDGSCKTGSDVQLPFTAQMIDKYISTQHRAVGEIERLMKKSQVHWIFQAFFRAFHFKAAALPDVWDMRIEGVRSTSDPDDSGLRGLIYPFSMKTILLNSKEGWEKSAQYMQFLPVKIELVDLGLMKIFVRAVGPPSDTQMQTDPIHIASVPDSGGKPETAVPDSQG